MKTLPKVPEIRKWELQTRVPVLRTRVPNFGHIYRHAIETPEGGRLDLIFFEILPTFGHIYYRMLAAGTTRERHGPYVSQVELADEATNPARPTDRTHLGAWDKTCVAQRACHTSRTHTAQRPIVCSAARRHRSDVQSGLPHHRPRTTM